MSLTVNGYVVVQPGETSPWGAKDAANFTAFANLLPTKDQVNVDIYNSGAPHLHSKLFSETDVEIVEVTGTTMAVAGSVTVTGNVTGANLNIANWDTAYGWGDHSAAGYMTDVINDTTPQLGGNLDVNGKSIVSVSNGNIVIAPNGTGITNIQSDIGIGISPERILEVYKADGTGVIAISRDDTANNDDIGHIEFNVHGDGTAGKITTYCTGDWSTDPDTTHASVMDIQLSPSGSTLSTVATFHGLVNTKTLLEAIEDAKVGENLEVDGKISFNGADRGSEGSYATIYGDASENLVLAPKTGQTVNVSSDIIQTTGKYIATSEVRAVDGNGLKLYEDGGKGIFIEDSSGDIGVGIAIPTSKIDIQLDVNNTTGLSIRNVATIKAVEMTVDAAGKGQLLLTDNAGVVVTRLQGSGVNYINGGDVGINDATPSYKLDVNGTFRAVGAGLFDSTLNATGDFKVNTNKLIVLSASGNTTIAGTLDVVSDFKVNTNKLIVLGASGNTTIGGTLTATSGLATFTDTSIRGIKQRAEFSVSKTGQTGSTNPHWETLFSISTYSYVGVLYISAKFIDDSASTSHYGFATVSFSCLNGSLNYTVISTDDFSGLGAVVLQLSGSNIQLDMGLLASLDQAADIVFADVTAIFSDDSIIGYTPYI